MHTFSRRVLTFLACFLLACGHVTAIAQDAENSEEPPQTAVEQGTAPTTFSESLGLVIDSLWEMWSSFLLHLPLLFAGAVILLLTWLTVSLYRLLFRRAADRSGMRNGLKDALLELGKILIWITGVLVAATVIFPGMTPAKLLTVAGLSSIAIGFAFKDIFENFFAGLMLLWKFPFDKGDFIECGDVKGKVEAIRIRMTTVRQTNGELIVVPNATLFKNAVNVLTDLPVRRVTVIAGVSYDSDVDQSRDVIREAVERCSSVESSRPVEIFAKEFASSSINFEVTWWTEPTPLDIRKSRDEVVAAVKRALDANNIEIPFPYRTLTFKEPLQTVRNGQEANYTEG